MKLLFVSIECELLSIEYLSAALKAAGHETYLVIDPKLFATELFSSKFLARWFNYEKVIIEKINFIEPDLVCFSVCSDNSRWALNLASAIKQLRQIPIVFGGIHPTIVPEEVMKHSSVDYVCVGEGEQAIVELAGALERGDSGFSIPNIWHRKNGQIYSNPPRSLAENLDELPFPDKELYGKVYPQFMQGYKIVTSRGCPYLCSYCASHQIEEIYRDKGKYWRRRSVDNVIAELRLAKEKYPVRMVRFFDDIFTADKNWLREFSRLYKEEINLPYFCFSHPGNCDEETIELLEQSGCATVFMGFGTYAQDLRENVLQRNYSNRRVAELIDSFKKSRIYLIVDFILGLPGQTRKEAIDMAQFFNSHRPDVLSGLFLRYYPKTKITLMAKERGILADKHLSLITNAGFHERIIIDQMDFGWFKKIQGVMLLSKYLPRKLVSWVIKKGFYCVFPCLDLNNFAVILDSILPHRRGKKRIHTDTVSLLQHIHFYLCHMISKAGNDIGIFVKSIVQGIQKLSLIYKLGIRRMNIKQFVSALKYLFKTKDCPGAVIIGVTYKCQCNCVHCSVGGASICGKQEMDAAKIKKLLDEISEQGIPKVNFFGGEPLMVGDVLVELVRYAGKRGISVSVDTNGIMLDGGILNKFKKAGINNINVSVDSADSGIHDELRGFKGAHDRAINALKLCVKNRIPCVLSTYASKRAVNSGDLEGIIRIGKGLKVTAVKILFPLMAGKWKDNPGELLSVSERRIVYDLLDPGFVYLESPLFSIKRGRKICEALDKKMIYVSPYGDVQICYTVPFSFGNVNDDSLIVIIRRMWDSGPFKTVRNNCDCVMNNPVFREKFSWMMDRA